LKAVKKVIDGQNLTAATDKYVLMRRCLLGDALAAFNTTTMQFGNEPNEHFEMSCRALISHVLTRRALQTQKRYMCRFLQKKRDMTVREFITRLVEINKYLELFPPGFETGQKLPVDEIMDIAEFGVPGSWQRQMILHDFDPVTSTPSAFIEFCERVECAEDDKTKKAAGETENPNRKPCHKCKRLEESETPVKYCQLHKSYGHFTDECKVVQDQIKKSHSQCDKNPQNRGYPAHVPKKSRGEGQKDSPKKLSHKEMSYIDSPIFYKHIKKAIQECHATYGEKGYESSSTKSKKKTQKYMNSMS
jgi:hypothetical protein